jgi:hypothetical protein
MDDLLSWTVQSTIKFPFFPIGALGQKDDAGHSHEFQTLLFVELKELL